MFSNVRVTNAQIEKMMSQASLHAVWFLLLACIWDMMGDGRYRANVPLVPRITANLQMCTSCMCAMCCNQHCNAFLLHCRLSLEQKKIGLNRTRLDYSFGIHGWHAQIQLQWMCVQDWHLRLCIIRCVSYQLEVSWFWNGFELVSLAKKKNMVTRNFAIVGRFKIVFWLS